MSGKPHFHIIRDPWIEVEYLSTHRKDVISPLHAFRDAKNIQISSNSPYCLVEAVQKLFMTAVLADALYGTEGCGIRRKAKLLRADKEHSGEESLEEIVVKSVLEYEAEGVSYDLFDEKRPFMQAPLDLFEKDSKGERKIVNAGCLSPFRYTGMNNIFHYHGVIQGVLENTPEQSRMSFPEYARSLMTYQALSTVGGSGYSPGIFTTFAPVFVFPEGKNLFETLLYMLPTWEGAEDERGIPAWRRDSYIIPKGGFNPPGFLTDVFTPVHAIRFAEVENGYVTKIYRQAIRYRKNGISTADIGKERRSLFPYFLTKVNDKKGNVLAVNKGMSALYDIVSSLLTSSSSDDITKGVEGYVYNLEAANPNEKECRRCKEGTFLRYSAYGVRTDQCSYLFQKKLDIKLPVLSNGDKDKKEAFEKYLILVRSSIKRIYFAACYAHGKTPEEIRRSGNRRLEGFVRMTAEHIASSFSNTMADYYEMHLKAFSEIGDSKDKLSDWERAVRADTELAMEEAYKRCTRHTRNMYTDWCTGLCVATNHIMRMSVMSHNEIGTGNQSKSYRKAQDIMASLQNLPMKSLYVLRNAYGKPYGSDPNAVMASRYAARGVENEKEKEKSYYYATIMAEQVIRERRDKKSSQKYEDSKRRLFQDFLVEVHNKTDSGKMNVNRLLSEPDIFSVSGIKLVTKMLSMAKDPIDLVSLCADLDTWDSKIIAYRTPVKWAVYIGERAYKKKENGNA